MRRPDGSVDQVRRQRLRDHQGRKRQSRSARHARLRSGLPRTARPRLPEDRLAGAGGARKPHETPVREVEASIKGDTVMVRRGKEKGKRGTSRRSSRKSGQATVEGLNVVKRHTKQGYRRRANRPASSKKRRRCRSRRCSTFAIKCDAPSRSSTQAGRRRQAAHLRTCGEPAPRIGEGTLAMATQTRLRDSYESDVRKSLHEKFGYTNVHQVPKLEKVVINMSVGDAIANAQGRSMSRSTSWRRSAARSRSSPRPRSRSPRSSCAKE